MFKRTYNAVTTPESIVVDINTMGTATMLIAVRDSIVNDDGSITVYEVADPAPHALDYGTLVEAIVALRYTTGAEIALNRLPDGNDEKAEYLAFVDAAKQAAKSALRLNQYAKDEA